MKEASTGIVKIMDCDRSTYDRFLRYLYYGATPPHLDNIEANQSMAELALRYDVPELFHLCDDALDNAMDSEIITGEWLNKVQQVHEILERRWEAIPETWANQSQREFRPYLKRRLRGMLSDTTKEIMRRDDVDGDGTGDDVDWSSRRYYDERSGLENGTIFEHADEILKSVLKACEQDGWIKDLLLFTAYAWINILHRYGFPSTEALRQVRESIALFIPFYGFYRTRSSDPYGYYQLEREEKNDLD